MQTENMGYNKEFGSRTDVATNSEVIRFPKDSMPTQIYEILDSYFKKEFKYDTRGLEDLIDEDDESFSSEDVDVLSERIPVVIPQIVDSIQSTSNLDIDLKIYALVIVLDFLYYVESAIRRDEDFSQMSTLSEISSLSRKFIDDIISNNQEYRATIQSSIDRNAANSSIKALGSRIGINKSR